ncbi:hypothetical protein [Nocardiopsis trehalosi]|uniref:hypothetical protein n=1 Tax=Nocardiopsis trehalosi TaxID=109329 RepID=UPI000830264C|nr:hypothetical protein [Nocardiopsis trehalosi]
MRRHDLTDAERRLWDAHPSGEIITFDNGEAVRAGVIAALLLGAVDPEPGSFPAVRVRGARITGRLDLDGAAFEAMLDCGGCVFEEAVSLAEASLRTLRITHSRLPAVKASRLRASGLLSLEGSSIGGRLRLDHARLESEVRLTGVTVRGVDARNIEVQGTLNADGITVDGEFTLRGGRVGADLDLVGGRFRNPDGKAALRCDDAAIDGRLHAVDIEATGAVLLRDARVGIASFAGARLDARGRDALNAGGATVGGGLFCGRGFRAEGGVRLVGAQIRGNLTLDGARLHHPGGVALNLDSAACDLVDAAGLRVVAGEVSMRNTRVTGQVTLDGAELSAPGTRRSLAADHADLGLVSLRGLRAEGEVMIRATRIGVRLVVSDARLHGAGGPALRASGTEIGSDLIAHGLVAEGEVRLYGMRVGRHVDLTGLRLSVDDGVALDAQRLTADELTLAPAAPIRGRIVLAHALIGVLRDDPDRHEATLEAGGLTYQALEPTLPARRRLARLTGGDGFDPQPYEQLAANYTALGLHTDARVVLRAKERRRIAGEPPLLRLWGRMQDVTTGYGYQPWRAFVWLALLLAAGSAVYGAHPPEPLKADEAPHFNAVVYTLDLMVPIADLGQERAFNPAGAYQWLSYALVAAGWVLATTIAAGAARVINRR